MRNGFRQLKVVVIFVFFLYPMFSDLSLSLWINNVRKRKREIRRECKREGDRYKETEKEK